MAEKQKSYRALREISTGAKVYAIGKLVPLNPEDADELLRVGAVTDKTDSKTAEGEAT